jgi:osmotically-inducible protein OsmY
MTTDRQTQERVLAALDWEPSVDAAHVGVTVERGVVTLSGSVKTFHEKWEAERVTRGVYGVRAIANELSVTPREGLPRTDSVIAEAAANALAWNVAVPASTVKATVSDGFVTLTGKADWQFQRVAAEKAVRHLHGVRGVIDLIELTPHVKAIDVKARIEDAFKRSAEVDAGHVHVEATEGAVLLTGTVRTFSERAAAERAAWSAPGVTTVDDRLAVAP